MSTDSCTKILEVRYKKKPLHKLMKCVYLGGSVRNEVFYLTHCKQTYLYCMVVFPIEVYSVSQVMLALCQIYVGFSYNRTVQ